MDREIVVAVLLLLVLTWLLYKLTAMLEPHDKPASARPLGDSSADASGAGTSRSRRTPIHQRLRK